MRGYSDRIAKTRKFNGVQWTFDDTYHSKESADSARGYHEELGRKAKVIKDPHFDSVWRVYYLPTP